MAFAATNTNITEASLLADLLAVEDLVVSTEAIAVLSGCRALTVVAIDDLLRASALASTKEYRC